MTDQDWIRELAKEHGLKIKDVLALTPSYDPFYVGSTTDHRDAKWASKLYEWVTEQWDKRKKELEGIGLVVGNHPHLRAIHYLLFTGHPDPVRWDGKKYMGTRGDWSGLQGCFKKARLLGYISFGEIEDHKHPHVTQNLDRADDSYFTQPKDDGVFEKSITPGDLLIKIAYADLRERLEFYLSEDNLKGIQNRIPVHIEIWTEKQREIVDTVAKEYWVNVQNAVGQQTYENVFSLLKRGMEQSPDRPVRVLYLSDFDPRGEMTMTVGVSRIVEWMLENIEQFEGFDFKLKKLILTREQIEEFNLPPAPVKSTESMKKRWDEHVGIGICEIDSIETLFATDMVGILRGELDRYFPPEHLRYIRNFNDRLNDAISEYNHATEERVDEITDSIRKELEPRLDDWSKSISIDLSTEHEKVTELIEDFEEPDWEVDDGDENEWLFGSDRSYLTQLREYKKVRGD